MPYKNPEEHKKQCREYYSQNKDNIKLKQKEYRDKNKDRFRERSKRFREENKEKIKQDKQKYYQENKEKQREYVKKNKDRTKLRRRKYHAEYEKSRKKTDPVYKAVKLSRRRIAHALNKIGLKKETKIGSFHNRFGCSREFFKKHIEAQFVGDMNWENWGDYWQLDHIIPLACAETVDEILMLDHYTNLRPLPSIENKIKHDTLPDHFPDHFPYWNHFLHVFEA